MERRILTNSKHTNVNEILLPANLPFIFEKYQDIIPEKIVPGEKHVFPTYKKTNSMLSVLFPLKEHPVHGKTGIYAMEKYDDDGYVRRYNYQWKIIIPKMSKQGFHISSWGNEPHNDPDTPPEFQIDSEPHHHHHVPHDWRQRKENWTVWTLEEVFEFVAFYIRTGIEYKP